MHALDSEDKMRRRHHHCPVPVAAPFDTKPHHGTLWRCWWCRTLWFADRDGSDWHWERLTPVDSEQPQSLWDTDGGKATFFAVLAAICLAAVSLFVLIILNPIKADPAPPWKSTWPSESPAPNPPTGRTVP